MAEKMIFQKAWYDKIMEDEYVETDPQEMAYILYAAAMYSFNGEAIDIGKVFGKEFKGLNRAMPNIYSQIDKITDWSITMTKGKQKYDNEAIKELAARGYTQKQICEELGYDVEKSKSLSSNPGYKEGRKLLKAGDSCERTSKETVKTGESSESFASFDF